MLLGALFASIPGLSSAQNPVGTITDDIFKFSDANNKYYYTVSDNRSDTEKGGPFYWTLGTHHDQNAIQATMEAKTGDGQKNTQLFYFMQGSTAGTFKMYTYDGRNIDNVEGQTCDTWTDAQANKITGEYFFLQYGTTTEGEFSLLTTDVQGYYGIVHTGTNDMMNDRGTGNGNAANMLWVINDYTNNGVNDAGSRYTFTLVESSEAPVETRTVTVESSDEARGTVAIEGHDETSITANVGASVVVTATAAEGYMFHRWTNKTSEEVLGYQPTYSYTVAEDITLVAEFVEKGYPIMTRYYEVGLDQQNRYLGEVSVSVEGEDTKTIFTCTSEEELPFTPYVKLHELQEEGAVVDKTEQPITIDQGIGEFTMTFKTYNQDIQYQHDNSTETCEPELVWTRQAAFIDWNNDFDFDDEGEVYDGVGNAAEDNDFGDPDGSLTDGWARSFEVPAGVQPGTYRMRVVYMAPNPYSDDWATKVFHDFNGELRNGVAYDFAITVNEVSLPLVFKTTGTASDIVSVKVETADGEITSGKTLHMGTEYTVTITNTDTDKLVDVTMDVNGEDVELDYDKSNSTYTYAGTLNVATEINVKADVIPTYALTWEVTGDGADLVSVAVITSDDDVESGDKLIEGTSYEMTVTNREPEKAIKVSLTVNDEAQELEHDADNATYTYRGTVDGDTHLKIEVTDMTGISSAERGAAYYDNDTETLHLGEAASVAVYDMAGTRVMALDHVASVSMAGLPDGVYVAVVDGNEIKFVK